MGIAIIGAEYQLGSYLINALGEEAIPSTHEELDVIDMEDLNILKEFQLNMIINIPPYLKTCKCNENPEKTFLVNVVEMLNITKDTEEIGAIRSYITNYIFEGEKGKLNTGEDALNLISIYKTSKLTGGVFTRNYPDRYYIIKVASSLSVAGANGKGGNLANWVIEKARKGEKLRIINDHVMSPTYTPQGDERTCKFLQNSAEVWRSTTW